MIRRYFQEPPIVQTPLDDVWSVIVPVARTNEISNPSLETATTGYTAGAGSLARSTTQQYHGAYSAAYTPSAATTDGFYYTMTSTVALRAVSCKFLGAKGVPYALAYASTAPAELVTYPFIATGRWQWIWLYVSETSATSRRIYFRKNSRASTATFYVDGVQSEVLADASERVSTYIDGEQLGLVPNQQPPAYYWNGPPHASTSTRSGLTRAGGEVVRFKDFGFTLMAIVGLGLAQPQNVATEYARIDGGYDDYTRKPTRQFTLNGRFDGSTYAELRANRGGLAQLFDRDLSAQDQRMLLLHNLEDECGNVTSGTSRVLCKYQDGLGGNTDGQVASQNPITFTQYLPSVLSDGEAGASLSVQTAVASGANGILQRSTAGVWSGLGTGASGGSVTAIKQGLNGLIYAAGTFTSMGGVANTNKIAVWDPTTSTWGALGTSAAGGDATELAIMPNGDIIAAGTFTSMGGVANTNKIAKWNGSAWSSISSGFTGTNILALAVAPSGVLYAGGTFSNIGGTAATNIASYNGATWAAVGGGIAGGVLSLIAVNTYLYAGDGDGTGAWKWDGSAWTAIDTTAGVVALAVDTAGNIYAGGSFSTIGGVSAANIAKWNGVAWSPLGTGLSGGSVFADSLFRDADGTIWAGGTFTSAGGITTPSGIARWNGSAWVYPDIIPGGSVQMRGGLSLPSGQLYINTSNNSTAIYGGITTIQNNGSGKAYPSITIGGPSSGTSRIYSIVNQTTNRSIYLNLTISAGETCILIFTPDALSFTSDFQGNIAGTILPGSNTADFFLQSGANTIVFLSADSTVTATLRYRPAYLSLDDVP